MRDLGWGAGQHAYSCPAFSTWNPYCQVRRESLLPHTCSGAALGNSHPPRREGRPVEVLPVGKDKLGFLVVVMETGHIEIRKTHFWKITTTCFPV